MQETINNVMDENSNLYLKAMEAKAMQDKQEQQEHIHQVTQQNAVLMTFVQEQQMKIEELLSQSKTLMKTMTRAKPNIETN